MKAIVLDAEWAPRPGYTPSPRELQSRKATMASQVLRHPRFVPMEVPDPTPAHGQVLLKVRACGVCGSDTHCYEHDADGYVLFSGPVRVPVTVGHEYTAEVLEVAPGVRNLRPGMLVAAEGMLYCGVCEACRTGHPNQCPDLDMVGFSSPGAYAEYIAASERFLWSLDPLAERLGSADRALELGALIEPIACSYNGMFVSAGGFAPGGNVVVFGCGPIGLGAIALARAAGAASVLAFETIPERRAVAEAMGADGVYDPREAPAAEIIRDRTRGWGADMMVEAAGAAVQTMPQIERAFAPGGKMVYLGRTGLRAPVMLDVLVTQAASIAGARGHAGGGCFPRILRLMEAERLHVEPMITRRFPFARTLEAVATSCDRTDGKILLRYD
ncbi:MAG: scyllo-inosose 3-dehydrogenase [Pseudomonadota bacterium]|nr:scyllo-inosose 3-dehydrogenase [Pseudomonadota bacterium]